MKKKYSRICSFPPMLSKGFTLIELLVVVAIMGVLASVTIAGFSQYNDVQTLQQGTADVVLMLNEAKTSAQSQLSTYQGEKCDSIDYPRFAGYAVAVKRDHGKNIAYELQMYCAKVDDLSRIETPPKVVRTKYLPTDIEFDRVEVVKFNVFSGRTLATGDFILKNMKTLQTKTITIGSYGDIDVN